MSAAEPTPAYEQLSIAELCRIILSSDGGQRASDEVGVPAERPRGGPAERRIRLVPPATQAS